MISPAKFSSLIPSMVALFLTLAAVMMTGCSSDKPLPDPAIAACPEKAVAVVQANQNYLQSVKPNETSARGLGSLGGLRRRATLSRAGVSMDVAFYQTGLPRCPWVMSAESLTPVVVNGDTIIAVGGDSLKDMIAKGWVLREATWPWQDYDFGYLPQK